MKVPRKLVITGDVDVGKTIIGRGDQQLKILENQMKFQGLKQGWRTIEFADGTIFDMWSSFNLQQVNIHVPEGPGEKPPKGSSCFANTGMAIARIIRVVDLLAINPEAPDAPAIVEDTIAGIFVEPDQYPDGYYCTKELRYDVQVCNGKDYLLYMNMKSTDYCRHRPGELVLVVMTRVDDIPDPVLESNVTFPCSQPAFVNRVAGYGDETVVIVPLETGLPQYEIN